MKEIIEDKLFSLNADLSEDQYKNIQYKMYDLRKPHCDAVRGYTDIYGVTRYRCTHEIKASKQKDLNHDEQSS